MKRYFITCKDGSLFCTQASDLKGAISELAAKQKTTHDKAKKAIKEAVVFENGKAIPVQLSKPEKNLPKKEVVTDVKPA